MENGLLDRIKDAEKYTVRVFDELVHKGIDRIVEHYEEKGLPRNRQARILSASSAIFYIYNIGTETIGEIHEYMSGAKSQDFLSAHLSFMRGFAEISTLNIFMLYEKRNLKNNRQKNDGTAPGSVEVASYNSIGGIVRPYLLAGTLSSIVYGITEKDSGFFSYGFSTLPFALSLYVRDDQSGGLIDRIKTNIQNYFKKPATIDNHAQ